MKIFDKDSKTNFVDDKNVFVGFDSYSSCCENFGYVLTKKIPTDMNNLRSDIEESDLEGYNFDKKFIQDLPNPKYHDEGGAKCFRLKNGRKEAFLTIYNYHNGYYSHGFEFKDKDNILQEGYL